MQSQGFFSTDFYQQIVDCQNIINQLSEDNFEESLSQFVNIPNNGIVKTVASSLLNRIKIKPQDADLVIDFIERHDEILTISRDNLNHLQIMPIFTQIVNPMPPYEYVYNEPTVNNLIDYDHFTPIPVSECFIYENLRQRGHITFDLKEYDAFNKMSEKMPHLNPGCCTYEVNKDFSFIRTIQYAHLMPQSEFDDLVAKFEDNKKNFIHDNPLYKEFFNAKIQFHRIKHNDFEVHKNNLRSGFNPSIVSTIIRKDEIEKFKQYNLEILCQKKISLSIYDCNILLKEANVLEYAAYYGSINIFNYVWINAPNLEQLITPRLQDFAVIGGNKEIYILIDEYSSNNNPQNNAFENSLPFSLAFHHRNISEELIRIKNCKTSPDSYNPNEIYSPCLNCFYFANWRDMDLLLQNDDSNLALFLLGAAMFDNDEMFTNLLDIYRIDLNVKYDKLTPINFLIRHNNYQMVKNLLDKGKMSGERRININSKGFFNYSPIFYCCNFQLIESLKVLIQENDIDINEEFIFVDSDEKNDQKALYFNPMTICLKYRQFNMARMILNHPKFDLNEAISVINRSSNQQNLPNLHISPSFSNMILSLNYLIEERKRVKKKAEQKIDVSSLEP